MKHTRILFVIILFAVILTGLLVMQPTFAQEPEEGDGAEIDVTIDVDDSEAVAEDLVELTVGTTEGTTNALEDFLQELINTPKSDLMRLILVVGGVILLVGGWRVYDYIVVIAGFVIGAAVALSLVNTDNTLISVGAILTAGLIGAALSAFVYPLGVFLIGAYVGIVLTGALAGEVSTEPISPLLLLLGGIIGGVILLQVSFHFLVVVASVVGAQMLVLGLPLEPYWILILAIVGIVIQLYLTRRYNYNYRRRPVNPLRRVFT